MSEVSVGVFGYGGDGQAALLARRVEQIQPGSARYFDLNLNGDQAVELSRDVLRFADVDLSALRYAYVHGFRYQYPVVPQPPREPDWSLWQTGHVLDQQKYSYILSLWQELERRGVRLLNGLSALKSNFLKYEQLQQLRRSGLAVPPMLCTNDPRQAEDFCRRYPQTVWRPATGHAAWQLCGPRQRLHLVDPAKPPIILAAVKDGPMARSYVIAGRPVLHLRNRAPGFYPVETLETFWADSGLDISALASQVAQVLQLGFYAVSLVVDGGTCWIYDVDADPVLLGLPPAYRELLLQALALGLTGALDGATGLTGPDQPQQRETLFLRRMLTVLFDMEASKQRPLSGDD